MTEAAGSSETLSDDERTALVDLAICGMKRGPDDPALARLSAAGLAMIKGPLVMPTPDGTAAAGAALRLPPGSEAETLVDELLDAFLPINRKLREVCAAWQTRPDGAVNDHSDVGYDDEVRERLDSVDSAIGPVLRRLASLDERFGTYRPRLTEALEKFDNGDAAWLASPMIESYHTVWMQLHQYLLLLLGMSRAEDEEREERLVSGRSG